MAFVWQRLRELFWSEWFWLPVGYTWEDMANTEDGIYKPQSSDIMMALLAAVAISILRRAFERAVAIPLGLALGLKITATAKAPKHKELEAAYTRNKKPSSSALEGLAKQTDMSAREVERWFRKRRNHDKPQVIYKFAECFWRCSFYVFIFCYGLFALWDKPWLRDSYQCWKGWPRHHISTDVYWYYAIEAGFYISLLFSQFTDVRRKDFGMMFIHHLVTLGLIYMSWMDNMVRVGTLVLLVHDVVDPWLEAGKMAKYVGKQGVCDVMFCMFGFLWFVSRVVVFPAKIIYSTMVHAPAIIGFSYVYLMFYILLLTIQVMNIFWFLIICKAVVIFVREGKGEDVRSSGEESVTEEDDWQRDSPPPPPPKGTTLTPSGLEAEKDSNHKLRGHGTQDVF